MNTKLRYISKENQQKFIKFVESINSEIEPDVLYRKMKVDRTTWYRWKEDINKLSIKRTSKICSLLGIDPTEFLTELEVESVAYARPYHKIEDLRKFFSSFAKAGLNKQAAAILLEMAALIQEVLTRNTVETELVSKVTETEQVIRMGCKACLGGNYVVMSFTIKDCLPMLTMVDRSGKHILDAMLGKTALAEVVRVVLMFDKIDKKGEKDGIGILERIGSKISNKAK